MSKADKAAAEKAKNYSAEQEAAIVAAAPLNLEKAKALAESFGKSWRSVVAKAGSMGVEYVAQEKPRKREAAVTKTELVRLIESEVAAEAESLAGLEKATVRSLSRLLAVVHNADNEAENSTAD